MYYYPQCITAREGEPCKTGPKYLKDLPDCEEGLTCKHDLLIIGNMDVPIPGKCIKKGKYHIM